MADEEDLSFVVQPVIPDSAYREKFKTLQGEINSYLNGGKTTEALKHLLTTRPTPCKTEAVRMEYAEIPGLVLGQIKAAEIDKVVNDLNPEQLDQLMKHIYAALMTGKNSSHLFKWHSSVLAKADGLGCIVRTLTDL
eukprot:TRINITY_DN4346_c0_g1_i1.p1 TRINITY_DN4346_c0_g1~~TRINITY_DN4346_c0_g1_i1.p1  ORF type:complete len:152 (-),score=31.13 TRINITY_DN4346_c0_g1_i1:63-473(-)